MSVSINHKIIDVSSASIRFGS